MRAGLLTTTALAVGLALPTVALAQQQGDPASTVENRTMETGKTESISVATRDFSSALTKLENAQKYFRDAEVAGVDVDMGVVRDDTREAIAEIERQLDTYPDQAGNSSVGDAREAIDQLKPMLELDRRPEMLAEKIGDLHGAVLGLQAMNDEAASTARTAMADQGAGNNEAAPLDSPQDPAALPKSEDHIATKAPDPNVAQTGKTETTVSKDDGKSETAAVAPGQAKPIVPDNTVAAMGRDLVGMDVYDSQQSKIGAVEQIETADDGSAAKVVIRVGGFLGIGDKPVGIDVADLELRDGNLVVITMTEAQIEDLPIFTPAVGTVKE